MMPEDIVVPDEPVYIQATLERKPDNLTGSRYLVDAVVKVSENEFLDIARNPLASRNWLLELSFDGRTVLLIESPSGAKIVANTEGADYVRYGARVA